MKFPVYASHRISLRQFSKLIKMSFIQANGTTLWYQFAKITSLKEYFGWVGGGGGVQQKTHEEAV